MNRKDRQALLAGALLLSILVGFGANWINQDEISGMAWSVAALLACAMVVMLLQSFFLGIYWAAWRRLPRKKLRRNGRTLTDGDAETVRINVQKLLAEYAEKPRFNFVSASSEKSQ